MKNGLLILFLLLTSVLYPQRFFSLDNDRQFTDSLEAVVAGTKSDSIKCLGSFRLSDLYYRQKDYAKYRSFLQKGNALSLKFPFLKAAAAYFNASEFLLQNDQAGYEKQLLLAQSRLKKFRNSESYKMQARILFNLSIVKQLQGNENKATQLVIKQAIPLARKGGDDEVLGMLYKAVGISLMNNGANVKAKDYFGLSVAFLEKIPADSPTRLENKVEIYCLNTLNFTQLGDYVRAKKSMEQAWDILRNYPQSNLNPIFYDAQSTLFLKLGQLDNTIQSCDAGIRSALQHHDSLSMNNLKINKLQALSGLKRFAEAKTILLSVLNDPKLFLNDRRQGYLEMARLNDQLGDYKAASHYKSQYIHLNDSLHLMNHKKEIAQLEATFKNAENEAKIRQLEDQKSKALLVAENNKLYNGIFLLLSLVLLTIIVLFWLHIRNQKKLAVERETNYNQSLRVLQNQKDIEVMQAAINGEELERKRIARDLHDGIGSMLSSQKMRLMTMHADSGSGDPAEMEHIIAILSDSISELRRVAYNMMPEVLSRLGLPHALSDLCFMYRSDKVDIVFHANEIQNDIPESIQITIYRIVQELINNALKHSEATEIIVDCSQNENLFFITVEDNGKGFDNSETVQSAGLGLKNLKNRLELLRGVIEIDSSPDYGTVFNIELKI